eukprot:5968141-Alexandrium_andersonii.AAC.1
MCIRDSPSVSPAHFEGPAQSGAPVKEHLGGERIPRIARLDCSSSHPGRVRSYNPKGSDRPTF